MTTTGEYRQWLSSAETDAALIETIQVQHVSFPDVWLVNWDRDITATLEAVPGGSAVQTFQAARFYLEPQEVSDGTEQGTALTISSLGGALYEYFADMTPAQRQFPVTITARAWLSNNLTTPVYTTPPVWTLHSVVATWDVLQGEIKATPLRVQRIGRYYTTLELPVLVYLR